VVVLELLVGLLLLFVGGEFLVRGAVSAARRLGVSPLVIGLTLVGFGTSMPELVASLDAALAGAPAIAIGNVVGSNVANILLILGLGALIRPIRTTREAFVRDGPVMLATTVLLALVCLTGTVSRLAGGALVLLLAAYLLGTLWLERRRRDAGAALHSAEADAVPAVVDGVGRSLTVGGLGLAGVLLGADLLVGAAIEISRSFAVSEAVIGLTVVAVGTSLPELATTIVATLRRQADVAFGNVVGSNIFNILGILGATALVTPIPVPERIAGLDVWVMLGVTVVAALFALTGWRLSRAEGGLLLGGYAAYVATMLI
jgi:cation:H+ antiporter